MNNLIGITLFERAAIKIKPREVMGQMHKSDARVCSEGGCIVTRNLIACHQELFLTLAGRETKTVRGPRGYE